MTQFTCYVFLSLQVVGVNTAAGDESYLSGRRLHAVDDLGWRGYAGVAPNRLTERFFDALRQLSGTHYRKLFSVVTLLQFLSLG